MPPEQPATEPQPASHQQYLEFYYYDYHDINILHLMTYKITLNQFYECAIPPNPNYNPFSLPLPLPPNLCRKAKPTAFGA